MKGNIVEKKKKFTALQWDIAGLTSPLNTKEKAIKSDESQVFGLDEDFTFRLRDLILPLESGTYTLMLTILIAIPVIWRRSLAKYLVPHFGQLSIIFLWLSGMYFHGARFSNYEAWLSEPTHIGPSAQVVWPKLGQEILNGDVSEGFRGLHVTPRTGSAVAGYCPLWAWLHSHQPARFCFWELTKQLPRVVTHPGIAPASNSLNFGVPTNSKPVSSQKASY
ncbi:hypothetical protein L3X38_041638 [Prunus dulcis]|uniref:Uncharacterized protein n=1 Tax=Prunus dulcis TaxID=3755 RepID=A0AAD4UT26_PRUDU|nr:hypothetical protein L3X38_041638 [Prunus dulcis]